MIQIHCIRCICLSILIPIHLIVTCLRGAGVQAPPTPSERPSGRRGPGPRSLLPLRSRRSGGGAAGCSFMSDCVRPMEANVTNDGDETVVVLDPSMSWIGKFTLAGVLSLFKRRSV